MNNLTGAARRVTRNFDQFSVICVFGSVVGCVVLPLMIQSMESFIITFLVLCLTAKPLKGHLFPSGNPQEHERRRSRDRDDNKKSKKPGPKKKVPVQVMVSSEQVHRMREEDLQKQEQQRLEDRERRLEEKREKKARKKEERLQRREEEKKEKEKEEQARRERQEARLLKKKEEKERKQKTSPFDIPTRENIQAIVSSFKPLKRERKHSTSSSASSISAHSTSCHPPRFQHHGNRQGSNRRHAAPFRASSDPELSVTARTSPAPIGKNWQPAPHTLPSTLGSSHWYTDVANRTFPSLPVVTSSATVSQPLLFPQASYCYPMTTPPQQQSLSSGQTNTCWSVPPVGYVGNNGVPSQVGESLQHLVPQTAWLPVSSGPQGGSVRNFSPAPGTATAQQLSKLAEGGASNSPSTSSLLPSMNYDGTIFNTGFGNTGVVGHHGNSSCYSLFSNGGGSDPTPFPAVGGLLNLDTSMDHMRHQPVSTGSPLSVNSDVSDSLNWLTCEQSPLQNQPTQQNGRQVEIIGPMSSGQEVVAALNEEGQQYDEWPNI